MKAVLDLHKAIKNQAYFKSQFTGHGESKNILFIAPELTAKHLYKFILPFFSFYNKNIFTAITSLEKFKPFEQIVKINSSINQEQILWADFIVFPFTTEDLSKEYGLYEAIREVKPNVSIVFYVDFNYYEMPKGHPHSELFDFPHIVTQTEKNILFSDICITTNIQLHDFLIKKFTELADDKFKDVAEIPVNFGCLPYLIDEEIVTQNIEWNEEHPKPVINKAITKRVAKVAEQLKKEDLKGKKSKAKKLEKLEKDGAKPRQNVAKSTKVKTEAAQLPQKKLDKQYRVGIIVSPNNKPDISAFVKEFQKLNEYGNDLSMTFIGYDYKEDKEKILKGVNFEYIPPMSIIHYFKQLSSMGLDLVVVPLIKNNFNITSENYNKYLECGLFRIPIVAPDIFPYNQIITHKVNGFLYKEQQDLVAILADVLSNALMVKAVGEKAHEDVVKNFSYNEKNIQIMSDVFE